MNILTPILVDGYVQWLHPWRYADGAPIYLYGIGFNTPYCPVQFETN